MEYKLKPKSWMWLCWRHNSFTTIGSTIYHPPGQSPGPNVLTHELVHMHQQQQVGLVVYIALYLFALPILWNPFRKKWETEAYRIQGLNDGEIKKQLRSSLYGWIL